MPTWHFRRRLSMARIQGFVLTCLPYWMLSVVADGGMGEMDPRNWLFRIFDEHLDRITTFKRNWVLNRCAGQPSSYGALTACGGFQ